MTNAGRVLMIPKGEYNSATTYEMLDFVYYQGRSYVCKQTSTGNAPTNTTYWQALTGADADKMDATNPTGTGSFSLNRKANTTIGSNSFAEGSNTTASGEASHAEGQNTTASGNYSHAEGTTNVASGYGSHAEGLGVTASGVGCHAEGNYTIAGYQFQHVCGKNNDNKATTLFEVGNGADPEADRSNAFEVYSDGTLSTDNGTTKVKLETLVSQNQALTNEVNTMNNVLGAKNLFLNSLAKIKAANTSGAWNDNTYTLNGGTFTITANGDAVTEIVFNGTFSTDSILVLNRTDAPFTLPADGTYILNGCENGSASTYWLIVNNVTTGESGLFANSYDEEGTSATVTTATKMKGYLQVKAGTYSNVSVKPMIRLANITDSTYQSYAMTNKELTDVAQEIKGNYVVSERRSVSVNADGTKSYKTLLNELATAFLTTIQGIGTDDYVLSIGMVISNYAELTPEGQAAFIESTKTASSYRGAFRAFDLTSSYYVMHELNLDTTLSSNTLYFYNQGNNTWTNNTDTVPANGNAIAIYYKLYKKIS